MAHHKGGGSSKNGRDSNAQRLGVKRYGGQIVKGGEILDFSWMEGADKQSVGPQHMSVTLSSGGTVIIIR